MRVRRLGALICISLLALAAAPKAARAQSASEYNAHVAWCEQDMGGTHNHDPNNPICTPPTSGGGSSGGGGYTASQQAMLNVAGQLGYALGAAIRQSFETAALERQRQTELNRMQMEWERRQAAVRAAEEERRAEERRRTLLTSMRGVAGPSEELRLRGEGALAGANATANDSELALRRVETTTLRPRSLSELFNTPNASGLTQHDVVVAGRVDAGAAPGDIAGRAVDGSDPAAVRQAWDDYLAALQQRGEAQGRLTWAQQQRDVGAQVRATAEQHVVEVRAQVAAAAVAAATTATPSAPAPTPETSSSLAEAERLLAEAMRLEEGAAADLEQAQSEADEANRALTQARANLPANPPAAATPPSTPGR
jgi:hypothetical protein